MWIFEVRRQIEVGARVDCFYILKGIHNVALVEMVTLGINGFLGSKQGLEQCIRNHLVKPRIAVFPLGLR